MFYNLGLSLPIYTTRKDAHGDTATYSQSLWMTLLVQVLIWLNLIAWGIIGLVEAIRMAF